MCIRDRTQGELSFTAGQGIVYFVKNGGVCLYAHNLQNGKEWIVTDNIFGEAQPAPAASVMLMGEIHDNQMCIRDRPNTASKPLTQNNTDSSPTQNLHMLHSSDEKVGKRAKTNDGLYFVELRNDDSNGSNLLYLDYATRQAIVVCEKPDCLHNDETCTAFFPYRYGAANSCVVGNYLYIIFSGSEKENILPALYLSLIHI